MDAFTNDLNWFRRLSSMKITFLYNEICPTKYKMKQETFGKDSSLWILIAFILALDDKTLHLNTPTQANSQLYCLEQAAGGLGLHVKAGKTEHVF